jgi:hypothetical protein
MLGVDKKDQLLHLYLVERKRVNKCYMKLFRRHLKVKIVNFLVIYTQNIERNVDHIKFWIELVKDLFVKYSILREISGYHDSGNIV